MADSIYQSLSSLGLPSDITLQEFRQLYQGPFSQTLHFISSHVKGRAETSAARRILLRQAGTDFVVNDRDIPEKKGEIKSPTGRSERDKAISRLNTAKNHLKYNQEKLKSLLDDVRDTERTISDLRNQLDAQRQIKLLLEALEEKERDRLKRIKGIESLLVAIRAKRAALNRGNVTQTSTAAVPSLDEMARKAEEELWYKQLSFRCSAVNDTLARLNSQHVYLTRLSRERDVTVARAKTAVRQSIQRKPGTGDPNVETIL
ncbi:hypothetical protein V5O48_000606 [Marasmius crinis-equi]|uniref:Uncharacterized protein n=1 Tax=Marasmius crinis-equi TaxID=585013 RepID=A0ABR3G0U8_9AGAR